MTENDNLWLEPIERYRRLREHLDTRIAELWRMHGDHIVCKAGCCGCCVNLTVFVVELYAIAGQLAEAKIERLTFDPNAACGWLNGGLCRIYAARPIICRTHGLPVAIPNEHEPHRKEVSFCPLNFTRIDPAAYAFGPDNTLDLADLNEPLSRINADFLDAARADRVELPVRISLARLPELLGPAGE